jgi:hypothetical protein
LAGLGALPEDLGAELAVVGIVALALVGAVFAGSRAGLGEMAAVVGIAGHEAGVQRRDVGDVAAEAGALLHPLAAQTLVGTPLTDLRGLSAILDTLALFVAQVIDLGDSL